MERVFNFVCFLILVGLLWVSLHLVWCWLLACLYIAFIMLCMFLVFLLSPRPLLWRDVVFCQSLFQHNKMIMCDVFCYIVNYIGSFSYVEPSLHSGMKPTGKWWVIFLMCSWIQFASILLSIFTAMFMSEICLLFF